jgi:nucleoid DNA-binding protein
MEEEVPFKFGKIGGKTVPARNGVNPKTGEKIKIEEKKGYPYFKASSRAKGKN